MGNQLTQNPSKQSITIPFQVGDTVTLSYETTNNPDNKDSVLFQGTIEQHIPQTGLLKFEDSDIGRAEFNTFVEQADKIRIEHR
jgi:hypothetical protein